MDSHLSLGNRARDDERNKEELQKQPENDEQNANNSHQQLLYMEIV